MPLQPKAETIEAQDCRIVLRRFEGPEAKELFLQCQPTAEGDRADRQAEAVYRALQAVLAGEGGGSASVVSETLFLGHLRSDLAHVRAGRDRVLSDAADATHRPAMHEIEQPPLVPGVRLQVAVQAIVSKSRALAIDALAAVPDCSCAECVRAHGLRVRIGDETRLYVGGLCGAGESASDQASAMFEGAERLLRRAGMDFHDVVRTWIHLRDIDRDYAELNRARRAFFAARRIDPVPASTGIGGGPVSDDHALCLGLYAVKRVRPITRDVMRAATLNEATEYGADFARGIRVVETNKIALHVSGTASIDEAGRTAHPSDFEGQAKRMLRNVAELLAAQGADFDDVVSAVTYLKRPSDAERLRQLLREGGYRGFPNVFVRAPICRSDLLCETEALAVLPHVDPPSSAPS